MINFEKQVRKIFRSHVQHVIDNPKLYGINPRFFTRVRKWPIARILLVMYKMQTGTLPDILFKNFIEMDEFGDSTPSAFIPQRQNLTTAQIRPCLLQCYLFQMTAVHLGGHSTIWIM